MDRIAGIFGSRNDCSAKGQCLIVAEKRLQGQIASALCLTDSDVVVWSGNVYDALAKIVQLGQKNLPPTVYVAIDYLTADQMRFFACLKRIGDIKTVGLTSCAGRAVADRAKNLGADQILTLNGRAGQTQTDDVPEMRQATEPDEPITAERHADSEISSSVDNSLAEMIAGEVSDGPGAGEPKNDDTTTLEHQEQKAAEPKKTDEVRLSSEELDALLGQ